MARREWLLAKCNGFHWQRKYRHRERCHWQLQDKSRGRPPLTRRVPRVISIASSGSLTPSRTTISAWVKAPFPNGNVYQSSNALALKFVSIGCFSPRFELSTGAFAAGSCWSSGDSQWHYLTGTFDATTGAINFFQDGNPACCGSGSLTYGSGAASIGAGLSANIDEIRVSFHGS